MRIQYQKLFHFFVLEFSFAYFNCLYVIANTLFSFFTLLLMSQLLQQNGVIMTVMML